METEKLMIPGVICPICNKKFIKTSVIVIVDRKNIIHEDFNCFGIYFSEEQNKLPEGKRKDIFRKYDALFRFTLEYDKSEKSITENEFEEYKKRFNIVYLMTERITVKKIIREKIWESVGRKYIMNLQYFHDLVKIYEKQKNNLKPGNFKSTFIPSVIEQFKAKGYLSEKQWSLVKSIVNRESTLEDRIKFHSYSPLRHIDKVGDISDLFLPDKLRYFQRRNSFIKWYNKQNGIPEEE